MKVIATALGYDNALCQFRQPGDAFEMPEGSKATWFKSAEEEKPAEVKKGRKGDDKAQALDVA